MRYVITFPHQHDGTTMYLDNYGSWSANKKHARTFKYKWVAFVHGTMNIGKSEYWEIGKCEPTTK